jgi:hypothetical protein
MAAIRRYDRAALDSRKAHKPKADALSMAAESYYSACGFRGLLRV